MSSAVSQTDFSIRQYIHVTSSEDPFELQIPVSYDQIKCQWKADIQTPITKRSITCWASDQTRLEQAVTSTFQRIFTTEDPCLQEVVSMFQPIQTNHSQPTRPDTVPSFIDLYTRYPNETQIRVLFIPISYDQETQLWSATISTPQSELRMKIGYAYV